MGSGPPESSLTCLLHIIVPSIWQCGSHYEKLHSTAVRSEIDSDSVYWREWPNYLAIHQLQQPPREQLTSRLPTVLVDFIGCPQKLNFLWQIRALWGFFPFNTWHEAKLPCGLCYNPCSCRWPNRLTIDKCTHFGDQYGTRSQGRIPNFKLQKHVVVGIDTDFPLATTTVLLQEILEAGSTHSFEPLQSWL